ncbi:MAG: AAA family ATPase [Bacteroidia bacterium]
MYIKSVEIKNIRSIQKFKMEFENPAGWHVLIGDNGAGKSSVVRSIAALLIGPEQIQAVFPVWNEWLRYNETEGFIEIQLTRDEKYDKISQTRSPKKPIQNIFSFKRNGKIDFTSNIKAASINPLNFNWGSNNGWFSVAFGPFRRFTGGEEKRNKVFYSAPKAGAHLTVFGEETALTETLDWIKELDRKRLKQKENNDLGTVQEPESLYGNESELIYQNIKKFINESGLLPHNAHFEKVDLDGDLIFTDGNKSEVKVIQMSDGYRSILSLTFELIRQLLRVYGAEGVFKKIGNNQMHIDLPGVVLIDEIDAHLHPTWQTRIGQWFIKYFPNIQFIVTTHSPLICRACDKGTIWRLAAPGSESESKQIEGDDRNRLVFGNVLDAYGTEIFGADVTINVDSTEMKEELVQLSKKKTAGKISTEEENKLQELRNTFSTDDKLEL